MADLQLFLDKVVAPAAPRPILALCHSMGAHIMMRVLAENGSGPLSAGVLCSPMTALKREAMLRSVLMLMPEIPAIEERYLFGTGPFVLLAREFNANFVTHDERRYRFTDQWFQADPRLALGGPTLGWGRQAVRSMTAAVAPGYLERIDLPLVLISAGEDPLIESATPRLGGGAAQARRALHHRRRQARDDDGDRRPPRPVLGGLRPAGERRARAMTLTQVLVTALRFHRRRRGQGRDRHGPAADRASAIMSFAVPLESAIAMMVRAEHGRPTSGRRSTAAASCGCWCAFAPWRRPRWRR